MVIVGGVMIGGDKVVGERQLVWYLGRSLVVIGCHWFLMIVVSQ